MGVGIGVCMHMGIGVGIGMLMQGTLLVIMRGGLEYWERGLGFLSG